ncbi:MAG: 16S rRNA (cytidine(1402)-2'-O)-methyltransferase [Neomegalonema sp.]|nr:16S rRNA (cytidine(1402)-2'-O)-methyltransferase [Neomegalonema sp.]
MKSRHYPDMPEHRAFEAQNMAHRPESKRRKSPPRQLDQEDGSISAEASGKDAETAPLAPGLYILATPIGNARDITLRALEALAVADVLVCEDTRMLRKLMLIHGIKLGERVLLAYHDHSSERARQGVLDHLRQGRSVIYASDAGTPLIADPGYKLVTEARQAGFKVSAMPGPSAMVTALSIAGLPTDAFCFCGFLPVKQGARRRIFEQWMQAPATLVFYETPARIAACLEDAAAVLGDRQGAICRELTKTFEEIRRGTLFELAREAASEMTLKGEIVLLIAPPGDDETAPDPETLDEAILAALGSASVKDIARTISEQMSLPRKIVYDRAVSLSREQRERKEDGA